MPTYTYICENGHSHDKRISRYGDVGSRTCPFCKGEAYRQSVYLFTPFTETGVKVGRLVDTPRDERRVKVSKFMEAAEELDYNHKKLEESVQHKVSTPDYFHEGYRQGYAIKAGKRPPTNEKF